MEKGIRRCLGVDLSHQWVDGVIVSEGSDPNNWARLPLCRFELPHDDPALAERFQEWFRRETGAAQPDLVVVESTGKLSKRFARVLGAWPVAIANPCQTRHHRKGLGLKGKEDRKDAAGLGFFGLERRPKPVVFGDAVQEEMRELTRLRDKCAAQLGAWKNRRRDADSDAARAFIDRAIADTEAQIEEMENHIREIVESSPVLSRQMRDLQQITGIKTVVAPVLTAELGDLSAYSRNALVAAAGLDPVPDESGQRKGRSRISKRGSKRARKALCMAARSLFNSKGALREHIAFLERRGLSRACITGIMMRKLLLIARAVVKNGGTYDPEKIAFQT